MHLSRCIDSILAQTYTDFELILINDGSNDNSGKLSDDYATKDKRIIVIHKENGGTSSARNSGLEIAKGEYITFVDSDDTISTDYLSSFTYNYDFEIAGLETISSIKTIDAPKCATYFSTKKEISDWFVQNFNELYFTTICSKIFRRNIINDNRLKFDSTIKRGEDTIFVYNYLAHSTKLELIPKIVYQYYFDQSLVSQRYTLNASDCINHILVKISAVETLENCFNTKFAEIKNKVYTTYLHLFYTYLNALSKDDKVSEIKIFRENCRKIHLWKALSTKGYLYWRILPSFLIAN